MSDPIEIGAIVHLKSGGPAMTVAGFSVSPAPAALQCYWMTREGVLQTHSFPEALLAAEPNEEQSFSLAARLSNLLTRVDNLEVQVSTLQSRSFVQAAERNPPLGVQGQLYDNPLLASGGTLSPEGAGRGPTATESNSAG